MHVIARPALVAFWTRHPDAKIALAAWYRLVSSRDFTGFGDLRSVFASADRVDGLTVFDIGGNKYRLIAAVHYNRRKIYIRAVLTHSEYDRGNWRQSRR